jgi:DNA-binding beta-propeller fold protein YncE
MNSLKFRAGWATQGGKALTAAVIATLGLVGATLYLQDNPIAATPAVTRFVGPTSSQPLALTADNAFLVVANPDNNSVTFLTCAPTRTQARRSPCANGTQWVVFLPDGKKVYVANTVSGQLR